MTYYSLKEIAEEWGVSPEYVRRLFHNEPDVIRLTRKGSLRPTIRVPENAKERVRRRNANRSFHENGD
jgi:DNA-binding LacI/PurR family transcriptional regulator